ncbi:MAG: hypothetical protein QM752_06785 [Gammaproteobacteria bacterium]
MNSEVTKEFKANAKKAAPVAAGTAIAWNHLNFNNGFDTTVTPSTVFHDVQLTLAVTAFAAVALTVKKLWEKESAEYEDAPQSDRKASQNQSSYAYAPSAGPTPVNEGRGTLAGQSAAYASPTSSSLLDGIPEPKKTRIRIKGATPKTQPATNPEAPVQPADAPQKTAENSAPKPPSSVKNSIFQTTAAVAVAANAYASAAQTGDENAKFHAERAAVLKDFTQKYSDEATQAVNSNNFTAKELAQKFAVESDMLARGSRICAIKADIADMKGDEKHSKLFEDASKKLQEASDNYKHHAKEYQQRAQNEAAAKQQNDAAPQMQPQPTQTAQQINDAANAPNPNAAQNNTQPTDNAANNAANKPVNNADQPAQQPQAQNAAQSSNVSQTMAQTSDAFKTAAEAEQSSSQYRGRESGGLSHQDDSKQFAERSQELEKGNTRSAKEMGEECDRNAKMTQQKSDYSAERAGMSKAEGDDKSANLFTKASDAFKAASENFTKQAKSYQEQAKAESAKAQTQTETKPSAPAPTASAAKPQQDQAPNHNAASPKEASKPVNNADAHVVKANIAAGAQPTQNTQQTNAAAGQAASQAQQNAAAGAQPAPAQSTESKAAATASTATSPSNSGASNAAPTASTATPASRKDGGSGGGVGIGDTKPLPPPTQKKESGSGGGVGIGDTKPLPPPTVANRGGKAQFNSPPQTWHANAYNEQATRKENSYNNARNLSYA